MLFRKLGLPNICSNCAREIIKLSLDLLFVVILVALGSIPERLLKDRKQAITCCVVLWESWHEAEVEPLPKWALFTLF